MQRINNKINETEKVLQKLLKSISVVTGTDRLVDKENLSSGGQSSTAVPIDNFNMTRTTEYVHNLIEGTELYEPVLVEASKPGLINYVLKPCIMHKYKIRFRRSYNSATASIIDLKKSFF